VIELDPIDGYAIEPNNHPIIETPNDDNFGRPAAAAL
jgi:hypothetical protein